MPTENNNLDPATGLLLRPGDPEGCPGNGEHTDPATGEPECCCDECDYYQQCFPCWHDYQ